jgi:hypothetical protein
MSKEDGGNLAVLIDADNVSSKIIAGLMAEVANYGTASVRRIYGDWTSPYMKSWREVLLEHSISPIQQFAYTTGKNASNGAMIIDAMDLLYTGRFSSFCLVSSDSDFTRLAARIREQGITVYGECTRKQPPDIQTDTCLGFGKRDTNNAFVVACNKFVYFDALPMPPEESEEEETATAGPETAHNSSTSGATQQASGSHRWPPPQSPGALNLPSRYPQRPPPVAGVRVVRRAFDQAALSALTSAINMSTVYEQDYVNLAEVGIKLSRISPDVNPRNYGYERLRDFIQASGIVELRMKSRDPHPPIALARLKGTSVADTSA